MVAQMHKPKLLQHKCVWYTSITLSTWRQFNRIIKKKPDFCARIVGSTDDQFNEIAKVPRRRKQTKTSTRTSQNVEVDSGQLVNGEHQQVRVVSVPGQRLTVRQSMIQH